MTENPNVPLTPVELFQRGIEITREIRDRIVGRPSVPVEFRHLQERILRIEPPDIKAAPPVLTMGIP